ncbi:hypothetical protein BDR05DRAFT_969952 [Suillus weaverae]|nr:hypothetical protein BDR05DRAFT_969952 [Suillus weaverae]
MIVIDHPDTKLDRSIRALDRSSHCLPYFCDHHFMSPDPTSQQLDEETPLLRSEGNALAKKPQTPLPWRQFSMLLVLQIAEPMTAQVILCHAQLIRDIGITHGDEALVSFYVGLLVSG